MNSLSMQLDLFNNIYMDWWLLRLYGYKTFVPVLKFVLPLGGDLGSNVLLLTDYAVEGALGRLLMASTRLVNFYLN